MRLELLKRWSRRRGRLPRYYPEALERHLRELGLSPYPAEEQQRDGR